MRRQLTPEQFVERRRQDAFETAFDSGKKSYFDASIGGQIHRVLPGEHVIVREPDEYLATVLGSCIAACIRDPLTGVGGMNHFMLPERAPAVGVSSRELMRYGNHAMAVLIDDLVKAGGRRERLEIKIIGGANVIASSCKVGDENAAFIRRFLGEQGLKLEAEDVGGTYPRRIIYHPYTGKVNRLFLRRATDARLLADERSYKQSMAQLAVGKGGGRPDCRSGGSRHDR